MSQIKTITKDGVAVYPTTKTRAVTNNERVRIITMIDNFTTIEEAMTFDIRDEDTKLFMDTLFNLIKSI